MISESWIAIDFGTTYCCGAIWRNNKVEIIVNEWGNRTTPSYVAFTDTELLIGDIAKNQVLRNPENTVFGIKRLIGSKFEDPIVQSYLQYLPFKVVKGPESKPQILINSKNEQKLFLAEDIFSLILAKLKETAESYLGKPLKFAIITVPKNFNKSQRQAIEDAGIKSGLEVYRIISEPIAAAIAYGLNKNPETKKNILVFDLGGGSLCIHVINIEDGFCEIVAASENPHLGGESFDNRMTEYYAFDFYKHSGIELRGNTRALIKLKTACERARRVLTYSLQASIKIDSLAGDFDFFASITREEFEELNAEYFQECLFQVKQVLQNSMLSVTQIDEVILVGGSTRIPKVQQLLKEFFNGKELSNSINPDEVVAYGATVLVADLLKQQLEELKI